MFLGGKWHASVTEEPKWGDALSTLPTIMWAFRNLASLMRMKISEMINFKYVLFKNTCHPFLLYKKYSLELQREALLYLNMISFIVSVQVKLVSKLPSDLKVSDPV